MGVSYIPVATVGEIEAGAMKPVDMGGRKVLVANVEDEYFVFSSQCPHEGVDLDDGDLRGATISCQNHYYCYSLRTGECLVPSDGPTLTVLPVEVRDGQICVRLEW